MPLLKPFQFEPVVVERNTPTSVPRERVLCSPGSNSRQLAGMSGRLPPMSTHELPVFVVLNTWPEPKPDTVREAIAVFVGSTVMLLIERLGKPSVTSFHVRPAFVLTIARP